jgi:hypothetical protein
MTKEPAEPSPDSGGSLTEGWPDEAGNEELAEFAARIRSSRPALPRQAMARIERAMKQAMAAGPRRSSRRWPAICAYVLSAAAATLLAVGVYLHFRVAGHRPASPPGQAPPAARAKDRAQAGLVLDTYRVHFASLPVRPPDRPLVRLEDYRTLYSDP